MECNPFKKRTPCQNRHCRWHIEPPRFKQGGDYRKELERFERELDGMKDAKEFNLTNEEELEQLVNQEYRAADILRKLWETVECWSVDNCLLKRKAGESLTLEEIADLLGVTSQAIERQEKRIFNKLAENPKVMYWADKITVEQFEPKRRAR